MTNLIPTITNNLSEIQALTLVDTNSSLIPDYDCCGYAPLSWELDGTHGENDWYVYLDCPDGCEWIPDVIDTDDPAIIR